MPIHVSLAAPQQGFLVPTAFGLTAKGCWDQRTALEMTRFNFEMNSGDLLTKQTLRIE
jgi:hypothetical protein